jgi:type IV secretion system protein TrbD
MHPHPFHKSSFRPHLLMGAERIPMLLLLLGCIFLNMISFNLLALGVTVFFWITIHPLLVWAGKTDPYLFGIWFRSRKYPRYIPAFTTPFYKGPGYIAKK